MSDFEEQEYWVKYQQRFEAALAIYLQQGRVHPTKSKNIEVAIETADELIAKLEETRTKK